MTTWVRIGTLMGQCGGRVMHSFNHYGYSDGFTLNGVKRTYKRYMLVATFNQYQRDYYEECCKVFTLLGQSTPIKNPSTSNFIFTAVFKA